MRLSIVVPVYCGGATVPELVAQLGNFLAERYDLEIVLVDDGSPDASAEVCKRLARETPWVHAVCLSRNFSEHNAVMAGLNHATGDVVVTMDDDLQNPPSEVVKLVDELATGCEVVYSRYTRKQHNLFRNLGSWVNDRVATIMLHKPRNLYLCSFRAMSRFVVDQVIKYDGPFPYVDGLILRTTRQIKVVTTEHVAREVGRSGYTLRKLISLWVNMFTSFSILPLRFASVLGLLIAGLGAVASVLFIIERLRNPGIQVGWASLMVCVLLLGGVQLFSLGMLGEYLGRMFLKVGGEPQFIVRETVQPNRLAAARGLADNSPGAVSGRVVPDGPVVKARTERAQV